MSETTGVNVARRAYNVDIATQFDGYSGVRIFVGTDDEGNPIVYEAGNTNGRVLDINNEWGTQAMANNILSEIMGYRYQPLEAQAALINPAAEMGDGLTVNGVYTGLFERETTFGRLMASDIKAPTDEEIAHEYFTDTATSDRAFNRFVRNTKASISISATEIAAEVSRATEAEEDLSSRITVNATSIQTEVNRATAAEGNLSTRITQTSNAITAEVSRAIAAEQELTSQLTLTASEIRADVTEMNNAKLDHTRTNSSFGWKLTSTGFTLNASGNRKVFEANADGVKITGNGEFTGKITASEGYIGNGANGFTIRASAITNGKATLNDNYDGIYIGTDGIALGSKFKVDRYGNVTASNLSITGGSISIGNNFSVDSVGNMSAQSLTLRGTLTMIGETQGWYTPQTTIDAYDMATGAGYANAGHDDWDWSTDEVSYNGGYWSGGADAGYSAQNEWDNAHDPYSWVGAIYSSAIITNDFTCYGGISISGMYVGGYPASWIGFVDGNGSSHYVLGYY